MFCPNCHAEYRAGYTHCPDCDVDLVSSLPMVRKDDAPELIWRGSDPVSFSRVLDVLSEAGINCDVQAKRDHLAFELGMPRPFYEIRVLRSRRDEALPLVSPIGDSLPLASQLHDFMTDPGDDPPGDDR